MSKKALAIPTLIMGVGLGWVLNVWGVLETVDWVWTALLALVGVLAFLVGGWNKITFVVGPLFLAASGLSVLRQLGKLDIHREVPYLVVLLGLLWLTAELLRLPVPEWMKDQKA